MGKEQRAKGEEQRAEGEQGKGRRAEGRGHGGAASFSLDSAREFIGHASACLGEDP